jgi:hypothetical protein
VTQKLLTHLERDIRNQVLFDSFRRPTRRTRLMIHWYDRLPLYVALTGLAAAWLIALSFAVRADELPKCPDPGVKCKILYLTEQEEQMLMTKNGILDTAAQARAIDLGQFSVYLKTRIAGAPAGIVTPVPASPPPVPTTQNNSPAPVDNPAK